MRICDLNTGLGKLIKAARRLREQWELTQPHWDDENAADFARNHIDPLMPQLALTNAAVNQLAELLGRLERECSDRGEDEGV